MKEEKEENKVKKNYLFGFRSFAVSQVDEYFFANNYLTKFPRNKKTYHCCVMYLIFLPTSLLPLRFFFLW